MSHKVKPEDLDKIWKGKTQIGGTVRDPDYAKKPNMMAPDFNTLLNKLPVDQSVTNKMGIRHTVLVVTPYSTEDVALIPRQLVYAKYCVQDSLGKHEAPYNGPLLYSQVINDRLTLEHDAGMISTLSWMKMCDLVTVYADYGITTNMNMILNQAKIHMKKIEFRLLGKVAGA